MMSQGTHGRISSTRFPKFEKKHKAVTMRSSPYRRLVGARGVGVLRRSWVQAKGSGTALLRARRRRRGGGGALRGEAGRTLPPAAGVAYGRLREE
ncbi:unnamed protein product [Arctogadus glacialis]